MELLWQDIRQIRSTGISLPEKKTEIKYIAAELYVKGENYASGQLCYRVETGR